MQRATLWHATARVLLSAVSVLSAALFLTACSESTGVEEEVIALPKPEPPPPPEPDWADNEMTIMIRVKTGAELLAELREGGFTLNRWMPEGISGPDFLTTKRPYTAKVSVITMKEMGLDSEYVRTEEIRERYKELGYEFFTFQEAIELRLHLHDQPDTSTGHLWSVFGVPPETDEDILCPGWNCMISIFHYITESEENQRKMIAYRTGQDIDRIQPDGNDQFFVQVFARDDLVLWGEVDHGTRLAVITERSVYLD